jgi:hypothetical protein
MLITTPKGTQKDIPFLDVFQTSNTERNKNKKEKEKETTPILLVRFPFLTWLPRSM